MSRMKEAILGDKYALPPPEEAFGGETYNPLRDYKRLTGQLQRVFSVMSDGKWRTLAEIAALADGTEAAVSARLRDFRKRPYGSHTVERQHIGNGLYQYRLIVRPA